MNTRLDLNSLVPKASQMTKLLKSLSNQDRLLILCLLSKGEQSVNSIEDILGIGQPTLSQQLGVLRDMGVVSTRREGKRVFYSTPNPKVLYLLQTLSLLDY